MAERKLVRDLIPQIMQANGQTGRFTVADSDDLWGLLIAKLHEEVNELAVAPPGHLAEELADIAEVFDTVLVELHIDPAAVTRARARKALKRGTFTRHLVWHGDEESADG